MRSGTSRLLAEGELRPDLELKLNSFGWIPAGWGLAAPIVRGQGRDAFGSCSEALSSPVPLVHLAGAEQLRPLG